jgi:hypothetical protein
MLQGRTSPEDDVVLRQNDSVKLVPATPSWIVWHLLGAGD